MLQKVQQDLNDTIENIHAINLEQRHLKALVKNLKVLYNQDCITEKARLTDLSIDVKRLYAKTYKLRQLIIKLKELAGEV